MGLGVMCFVRTDVEAPRLAKTPASRSSQAAQATPKGLRSLPRATESHAANPLLDVNAIVGLQLHVRSSNLYLQNTHYST